MTALTVLGRAAAAIAVTAALIAWILLTVCLAVVYGAPLIDALTGGLTP
jgi:hypothetical protein